MARVITPLTATEIKTAKPKEKNYKLFDGGGLFLLVTKSGGKHWKLKYRFNDKEKTYAIGAYPAISLSQARSKREELKALITDNTDPNDKKKQSKKKVKAAELKKTNTFYNVSQKWLINYASHVSEDYHSNLGQVIENHIYPHIKYKPIDDVTRLEIIAILEDLKRQEKLETGRRVNSILNRIYKYAVTRELTPHNIIADIEIREILGKKVQNHYPALTKEKEIKGLLLSIDEYVGAYSTKMALKVLPYVFVRSYNIRHMEWSEIDFDTREWIIPAHKMKTKEEFTLPLSQQVINLLLEIKDNSTSNIYVFPSPIHKDRPLSDVTLISAFRRMGYTKEEFVPHSFRSIFSTITNEKANSKDGHQYTGEVIEACLAHKEKNLIKAAYNRSNYKEAMRGLVEWYASYLDRVKNG